MWLVEVGRIYGCGCKEVYLDFLILLIPTPLVSARFCSNIPTICSLLKNVFRSFFELTFYLKGDSHGQNLLFFFHKCNAQTE